MKFRTRYPALIEGRVKRMVGERLILCLPEDEFEMREVTSAEAPVAIVVTQHDTRTEYRLNNGALYTPLQKMPTHITRETDINPVSALLKSGHPMFGDMAEEIREIARHQEANGTRPERLSSILMSSFIPLEVTKKAIADAEGIVETETSAARIEFWKNKARERIAGIILIDGQHWVATPEPAYKLWLEHGFVEVHHSDVFDNGLRQVGRSREMDWERMSYRYFSAVDLDGANQTFAKLGREGREFSVQGEIEVIIPEAIRNAYADLEIDRAGRVCVRNIEHYLKRLASNGAEELRSFPRRPLMATCNLRDAIAGRSPFDPVDDSVVTALDAFLEAMEAHPKLVDEMDFEDIASIRDALEIWFAQEILPSPALVGSHIR
jgi:hypothetical protein